MPRVRQPGGAFHVRAFTSAAESSPSDPAAHPSPLFLGFDFGTSGARAVVIDGEATILADVKRKYPPPVHADSAAESAAGSSSGSDLDSDVSAAEGWRAALFRLLREIPEELRRRVAAVSLDGTSATTMVVSSSTFEPVIKPMMYNEAGTPEAVAAVAVVAPANHTATAGTSTLCKLMTWWLKRGEGGSGEGERGGGGEVVMVHQADWLLGQLCGGGTDGHVTDFNNALKLGYDPESEAYPDWLLALPLAHMLPRVLAPGGVIGTVSARVTEEFALPLDCIITTGTTDSIAAFLAARVTTPGDAVTSLGSTLAVKLVSTARIDDARFGVYSHRLPPGDWAPPGVQTGEEMEHGGGGAKEDKECKWLVGGASNTGGAVLREYFTDEELRELSAKIDPKIECKLDYYPLTRPGERFPVSNPDLQPRLSPRPADDSVFLHGILESIATIEARAYSLLADLGASPVQRVYTAGGGAGNPVWTAIRGRVMGVPVAPSDNTDAAFGSALLAREGFVRHKKGTRLVK
ncbi:hypothetical protein CLOM_g7774 [Closterium sp. NIES-68]|nr:hypothetical protein CLOM_g7774 [Closterium sp. NIES-68]GJP77365.1 hypothetical protein CLOP_g7769 [Closterium sp. NIES-67]